MLDRRLWRQARSGRTGLWLTILLGLAGGILTVLQAYLLSRIVDRVFLQGQPLPAVATLLAAMLIVILSRAGLVWAAETSAHYTAIEVKGELRSQLLGRLMAMGPAALYGERAGELTTTMVEGVDALDAYFSQYLPQLALSALVPLTILLVVLPADPLSGLVLLLTAPLIPLFMVLIGRAAEALTRRQWDTLSRMSAHFLDILQGLTTLKALGQSDAQAGNIARTSDRFRQVTLGVMRVAFLSALVLEFVSTMGVAIVAVQIGLRLLEGGIAFADALFILILAPEFYLPLRLLGARYHAGLDGVSAANRIFALLQEPVSLSPPAQSPPRRPAPQVILPAIIRFERVSVTYGGRRQPALKDISLVLEPGQKVALVGPSGSGKSTVVNLLLRFVEPGAGRITAAGLPLREIDPDAWRAQIAWVPQSPTLFHDTVAANIRLGRPEATPADVQRAARLAYADGFVEALPDGYETVIGERAIRLSSGQAQRLALARAFLRDAPLLILDEPTSSLDPENEALLQASTEALLGGRSVLVIAHRLSTVTAADRILVIDAGQIVESGRHGDLMRRQGLYHRLVTAGEPG